MADAVICEARQSRLGGFGGETAAHAAPERIGGTQMDIVPPAVGRRASRQSRFHPRAQDLFARRWSPATRTKRCIRLCEVQSCTSDPAGSLHSQGLAHDIASKNAPNGEVIPQDAATRMQAK